MPLWIPHRPIGEKNEMKQRKRGLSFLQRLMGGVEGQEGKTEKKEQQMKKKQQWDIRVCH